MSNKSFLRKINYTDINNISELTINNCYYIGELKDNKANGVGVLYNINRRIIYFGEFKNNKYHGYGILFNGHFHGQGIFHGHIHSQGIFINNSYGPPSISCSGQDGSKCIHGHSFSMCCMQYKLLSINKKIYEIQDLNNFNYSIKICNDICKKAKIIKKEIKIINQEIKEDELCLICMAEKKNMAFIPCGHLCMCEGCSKKYEDDKCIMCRKEFSISYKIFF